MLMDKYVRQRQERARAHLNENQREGSPYYGREHWVRYNQRAMTWQKIVGAQASQKARAEDPRLFYGCEGWSRQELSSSSGPREDKWNDDVVMVGSVPCKLQSIIYMGGGVSELSELGQHRRVRLRLKHGATGKCMRNRWPNMRGWFLLKGDKLSGPDTQHACI
jgi:hypothetical protein